MARQSSVPAAPKYFVHKQGQTYGPVEEDELGTWALENRLTCDDLVCLEGSTHWEPATKRFPGLKATAPTLKPTFSRTRASDGWSIVTILAGIAFLVAFFLPWWGMTISDSEAQKLPGGTLKSSSSVAVLQAKVRKVIEANQEWYLKHWGKGTSSAGDGEQIGGKLWGWDVSAGIAAFVIGFFVIACGVTPLAFRGIGRWSWISSFLAAALAIPVFTVSLIWLITAPSQDVEPVFYQGIIAGPYVDLAASVLLLSCSLFSGTVGAKRCFSLA